MKFKKWLIVLVLVAFLAGIGGTVFAADISLNSIGHIDVQKVFKLYKETDKAQDELKKQEEDFRKEFEKSQEKLEKAEKDGKSRTELEEMRLELEKELNPKRERLLKLNEQLTTKLQLEILGAVKQVAKNLGLELVLDKQVVITGGMDVSEMVINELNK